MIPQEIRNLPDGREIKYRDTIHHHTETRVDFMDRIRILFHGKINISSRIYTAEFCSIMGSEAKTFVPPIFKRKSRVVGLVSTNDFTSTKTN